MPLEPLPHEQRITFDAVQHTYTVDGVRAPTSVTGLVGTCFEAFDGPAVVARCFAKWKRDEQSKYFAQIADVLGAGGSHDDARAAILASWDANGRAAADAGTRVHAVFEARLRGEGPCAELDSWIDAFEQHESGGKLRPFAAEVPVFDTADGGDPSVAGCVDALFRDEAGDFWLVDWKTSKGVDADARWYRRGLDLAAALPDTKFHRYSLQLALYAAMLESCAGIRVGPRRLIVVAEAGAPLRTLFAETRQSDGVAEALLRRARAPGGSGGGSGAKRGRDAFERE